MQAPCWCTPVVHAGHAAWFVWEHRFDDAPFEVTEFIAHVSKLQFGSLNHARGEGINSQAARLRLEGKRTYRGNRQIDAIVPGRRHSKKEVILAIEPGVNQAPDVGENKRGREAEH
jgi:hypothetical protein